MLELSLILNEMWMNAEKYGDVKTIDSKMDIQNNKLCISVINKKQTRSSVRSTGLGTKLIEEYIESYNEENPDSQIDLIYTLNGQKVTKNAMKNAKDGDRVSVEIRLPIVEKPQKVFENPVDLKKETVSDFILNPKNTKEFDYEKYSIEEIQQ